MPYKTTMLSDNSERDMIMAATTFLMPVEAKQKQYAIEVSSAQDNQSVQFRHALAAHSPPPTPLERPNIPPTTVPDLPKPGDDKPSGPDYPPNIHPDTEPTTTPPQRLGNWHWANTCDAVISM